MIEIRDINPHIRLGLMDLKDFSQSNPALPKREVERAGTRLLLSRILNDTHFILNYTPTNKPFLSNHSGHISISHSHDKLAIILNSKQNTGIDIELIREKVISVKHKFLNTKEALVAGDDPETLIYFWAAKETLYKIYGLKGLDFALNLSVDLCGQDEMKGKIDFNGIKKIYRLKKEKINNYCLVYSLNEI